MSKFFLALSADQGNGAGTIFGIGKTADGALNDAKEYANPEARFDVVECTEPLYRAIEEFGCHNGQILNGLTYGPMSTANVYDIILSDEDDATVQEIVSEVEAGFDGAGDDLIEGWIKEGDAHDAWKDAREYLDAYVDDEDLQKELEDEPVRLVAQACVARLIEQMVDQHRGSRAA